jgi:hypothetical protein
VILVKKNENKIDNSFKNDISKRKFDLNKLVNITKEVEPSFESFNTITSKTHLFNNISNYPSITMSLSLNNTFSFY